MVNPNTKEIEVPVPQTPEELKETFDEVVDPSENILQKEEDTQEGSGEDQDTAETEIPSAEDEQIPEAEEKKEEAPSDEQIPEWNETLLAQAQELLGYNEKEARAFGTPENLSNALGRFDKRIAEIGYKTLPPADQQTVAPVSPQSGQIPIVEPVKDFEIKLDPEVHGEDVIATFKGMKDFYGQQLSGVQKEVQEMRNDIKKRNAEVMLDHFDGMIDGLGKAYKDTFGEGPTNTIRNEEDYENRMKVMAEMTALKVGFAQIGFPDPSIPELFARSVRSVFGAKAETIARKEITAKLDKRSTQFIGKPSGREGSKPILDPTQDAVAAVEEKLREQGKQ